MGLKYVRATDQEYYKNLIAYLKSASSEILMTMFHIKYNEEKKDDPGINIIKTIKNKRQDGLNTIVIVNDGRPKNYINRSNMLTVDYFKKNGVDVHKYPERRIMHSKLVIIDRSIVGIGSHNINFMSMRKSAEASLFILDQAVAEDYRKYFFELISDCKF